MLDRAHRAMEAAPGDDAARLRFYERLADAELFLLLEAEPKGETVAPQVFPLDEGRFALAFDTEERLAEFTGAPAPYAALPGRVIARALAGQGVGLGLNLGVAPSAYLMPTEALGWLAGTLDHTPDQAEGWIASVSAPQGLPEAVVAALDAKLAGLAGLARAAHLVAVGYGDARRGHLLAFEGAVEGAEAALAKAVSEALVFSGIEAGEIDVAFPGAEDPLTLRIARVSLRFDLPVPEAETVQVVTPAAPGMNPARPPKLK
ncbi:SseB family protein [Defluviimonas sp. WL0050]|uniref:SseB family protein n=1 Tax=Albidovulum litorale TaxID=2984134 RepID=A0ABT2ZST4_9RHOB|nr:SseB family protein [Defluviimonas sp. WL0050]MCV2874217.1 SseB family protein [Defluviimonas sp. WL0050]